MKLRPVICDFSAQNSLTFNTLLRCLQCGQRKKPFQMLADLNGEAFIAYYCMNCNEPAKKFPDENDQKNWLEFEGRFMQSYP